MELSTACSPVAQTSPSFWGVSLLCFGHLLFLLQHSCRPLSIVAVWAGDLGEDVHVLFLDQVWGVFGLSSENPSHQIIHWKLLHRVYLTPMKRFYMNLSSSPKCKARCCIFFLGVPLSLTFLDSALTGPILFVGY